MSVADNAGAFNMEVKSTAYGILGVKPLLKRLRFRWQLVRRNIAPSATDIGALAWRPPIRKNTHITTNFPRFY